MKINSETVSRPLRRLRSRLLGAGLYDGAESPLRSELYSARQMERHGKILARSHTIHPGRTPDQNLIRRLAENEAVLIDVCVLLSEAVRDNRRITPAGEWLLDNLYLIEEHIHTGRKHLPKGYSRELPRLLDGASAGLPRVYDIALETISHGDGRVDPENLGSFIAAYQTVSVLRLGELWAIPIMLRLALIENLRRVAARIAADMIKQNRAEYWADRMIEIAEKDPKSLILVIADMARSNPPMVSAFVAELSRRLQGQSSALALPLTWIEQRLSETGQTIKQLVQAEIQQQAADQVSMSNSIGSLRFLGAMDWHEFVETMSHVEQTLREDPNGSYPGMDFATRDRYRHVIEMLSRLGVLSELDVARSAIDLAAEGASKHGKEDRAAHVGFYLLDGGLGRLERMAKTRMSPARAIKKVSRRFALFLFLASIALSTAFLAWGVFALSHTDGLNGWTQALFGVLLAVCAAHPAVSLVNWLATLLAHPDLLPRMDFSRGIPPEYRTLVVIPTMITSPGAVEDLAEALEVRFLANRDDSLHFALLTDFRDAERETLPEDEALVGLARDKIAALNRKYRGETNDTFFLFHRPRLWNPRERLWMGYERKRGKLADLNSFLRGGPADRFSHIVGNTGVLTNVRYVITLDTDTQLPRDSARQFAGAMAHPLNRARFDPSRRRIVEGYGILQPRVAAILPGTNRSRYAELCGSEPGIDPYTRVVSDVYQDLFSEGSFIGKGIYDIDAFDLALKERLPENLILSHDLLEGCYARAGLLSDVQLYEEYPSSYGADVNRRRRWIRGDWQIMPWILPFVPGPDGAPVKNPITLLSRWKIFDNLRRSVTAVALTLIALAGWTLLSPAWLWTMAVIGIIMVPSLLISILDLFKKSKDMLLRQHFTAMLGSAGSRLAQGLFALACLPHEAWYSTGAIALSAWRLIVTRRRLLEWNTSGNAGHRGLAGSFLSMAVAPITAVSAAAYLAMSDPAVLAVAGPVLALWFASPALAWWLGRPLARPETGLSTDQTLFLRNISRKTWSYFERFVGPDDNWLPPDNFQENPVPVVAHRTSPTNMGMAVLADLGAYDFGYLTAGQLIERLSNTFHTMGTMEKYRGHFYNWYDTRTLRPLYPLYISTVDSGNLAGHLLTLRFGLLALPDHAFPWAGMLVGIGDTLGVLEDVAGDAAPAGLARLRKEIESAAPGAAPRAARAFFEQLAAYADEVAALTDADPGSETAWWASSLARHCRAALDELTFLAPWTSLRVPPDTLDSLPGIDTIPTLRELAALEAKLSPRIERRFGAGATPAEREWLTELQRVLMESGEKAGRRIAAIERLALQSNELATMEYDFLYDRGRHLLAIGYNVNERRREEGFYDLLASEARFGSFVAIAQGHIPQDNWFALGRQLTVADGRPILMSWSGSMFEYLMPLLTMPLYDDTLIDQTCRAAVKRQIEYGRQRGVAWGISESGYNMVDVSLNYQYRAFGVPGLGFKRGLADDLVIAPYASMLALLVAPAEACLNLQKLADEGFTGRHGFYEAIDYTPSRLKYGRPYAVVRSFMAHHAGMSFLSLAGVLLDRPMQKRFQADPLFQATMLLLQERIPRATAVYSHTAVLSEIKTSSAGPEMPVRIIPLPDTPIPEVQLLSNGNYHVMVSSAGGGYSRWRDLAVTRWREDGTRDNWGTFCYIRDTAGGEYWSNTCQPTLKEPSHYEAVFSEGRAEFRRRDNDIDTLTLIVVSPEDDIELRRIRLTNMSRKKRTIEITSYAEVVLSPPAADSLHPAFGNLFVQTEIVGRRHAILCNRRPRSTGEKPPYMFHLVTPRGAGTEEVSYETDRMRFIGRGNSIADPQAMDTGAVLSGSDGSVLDPIVSIRHRIALGPEENRTIDIVTGIGQTREDALGLVDKYQDRHLADRVFDLAWTHSQVMLLHLNATEADAQLFGHLAGSIIYANANLRADPNIIINNRRGQPGLWGYSISGDLPIVLLRIEDATNINLVRQLVGAHAYWRVKGLPVDLVIWNEEHAGYRQLLHDQIMGLIASGAEGDLTDRSGGIFLRHADQISAEDRILIQTVARAIITDRRGALADQINRKGAARIPVPQIAPSRTHRAEQAAGTTLPRTDLIFYNGCGGFTPDGREYIITTAPGQRTPAPWVNVLANPDFGTIISESGMGYTWAGNAHEFRLTPWHNDPVGDSGGEAFYLRDEERGHFWSPMPLPGRGATPYATRHGFGYSVFEHTERGIRSEAWVYVGLDSSVKFTVLKVHNESGRPRRLSATGYMEWVLGDLRPKTAMHITTEIDPDTGALLARNPYNTDFADRVAFFDVDDVTRSVSGDRADFLGRNGTLRNPAAMGRVRLSGRVGSALDPCAAIQVPFELADGQGREITFRLGVGRDADDAENLIRRFRGPAAAHEALEAVWQYWSHTLGAVQVETPDQSLNVLANGWLIYQTLACRMWARSGYYQSGGAFGFRDQLQDVMALIHTEPRLVRRHLLLCASRQFDEGDVQHWWHPPSGRGVRTHCSDDFLWLPLATARYVLATGDTGVLDEPVQYIRGRQLNAQEESYYDLPARSEHSATLYDHCVRALQKGENYGEHGLPLIGSGDWNDGMNTVGENGRGESVWLGFFYHYVLTRFAAIAEARGDQAFAQHSREEAVRLGEDIERHGWDGEWYRRAYFDDGTPLGSAASPECRIDFIAQSWAVLSGAGDPARARMAMEAADQHLVRREHGLVQLLYPPFDTSDLNPGYIKGYVPGVRENGGQYTHAAVWAAMAFAAMGDKKRAWELQKMINPVNHAHSPEGSATYKVEPYVMAADVYSLSPHTGRGGWTWYTGSAGWMYRLIMESLLGLGLEKDRLTLWPCIPADWDSFKIHYRYRETIYHITILQTRGAVPGTSVTVDGAPPPDMAIPLVNDHREHSVEVRINIVEE
ncbi:MAG TPA: glucoamylase family protein [Spirochaetota bacterium]|nr:glucoamylase family protein [Spirochaetota bacterium]